MCYFGTNNRLLIYPWCVILPTGQWGTPPLLPTSHWGTAALWGDKAHWKLETLSGWPDVLFRDKYAFLDTCIICDTPNRPLRNTSLLPTGHWGMDAFDTTMGQVKHIKHWKPSGGARCVIFEHVIQTRCLLIGETPNRPVRNAHYSQSATEERRLYGAIGHIQHWEHCLGDQMCYFGTNNRRLIYPWCVILPTGQWGTHHYSQPAAEEWMHFKEI